MENIIIEEICVVTEASDESSYRTKLSMIKFIEHNVWFNGTIYVLLTLKGLSKEKQNGLNSIYKKVKFIKTEEPCLDNIRKYAFKIKSPHTIYINNSCLILNDISNMLSSDTISSHKKNILDFKVNLDFKDDIDSRLMSISGNMDTFKIYDLISKSKKSNINDKINVVISKLKIVPTCDIIVTKSEYYPNSKYSTFIRWIHSIRAICYNFELGPQYSRINTYWVGINKKRGNLTPSQIMSLPDNKKTSNVKPKTPIIKDVIKSHDVSVIIAAFKAQDYIEECINSILTQNMCSNIEILIGVDNCKKTKKEVIRLSKKHSNIKCFYSEEQSGPYLIRNSLINECSNDNILFFDADDVMSSNLISEIFKHYSITSPIRFKYFNFKHGSNYNVNRNVHHDVAHGVFFSHVDVLKKVGGFQPWMCGADTEFMKRCSNNKIVDIKIHKPLFYRRIHENSLTQNESTNHVSNTRKKARKYITTNKDWTIPVNRHTINLIKY